MGLLIKKEALIVEGGPQKLEIRSDKINQNEGMLVLFNSLRIFKVENLRRVKNKSDVIVSKVDKKE